MTLTEGAMVSSYGIRDAELQPVDTISHPPLSVFGNARFTSCSADVLVI